MYFLKCVIRNSTYLFAVGSVVSPCNTNVTIWHYTSRQGVDQNKTAIEAKMWSSKINSLNWLIDIVILIEIEKNIEYKDEIC